CRWDRATPSTLAMVFIGKRPSAATRAASSVFCLCLGESLLEDFHLHGFTAEKALQLADPLLEPTNLGVAHHRFIRAHSCRASLRHQTPPSVEKVRRHAMPPCHRGDRFPRLAARLGDPKLLFRRPAPPTRCSSDQFNSLIVVRHRHVLEVIPKAFLPMADMPESNDVQQETQRIDQDVPFTTFDLLARVDGSSKGHSPGSVAIAAWRATSNVMPRPSLPSSASP